MSYKVIPYTYGKRNNTDINSLTGMSIGDTVFNYDTQLVEIYNGVLWVDERSVMYKIAGTEVVSLGECVKTNTNGEILRTGASDKNKFAGVVTRGGSSTGYATVAFAGKVQVLAGASIVSGQSLVLYTNGRVNDDSTPGSSVLGWCMESKTSGNLAWMALQTIELY